MVDPIFTYVGGIAFLVLIIGSMLYLTFSTQGVEDDSPGESVVKGVGADGEPVEEVEDEFEPAEPVSEDSANEEETEEAVSADEADEEDADADEGDDAADDEESDTDDETEN